MKTQTFGLYGSCRPYGGNAPAADRARKARANYKSNRLNGDEKEDGPPWKLPEDGKISWPKGEVKGDNIYGVKESDGYYHYECRYDSGDEDKKWMAECDRNYLVRLHLSGTNIDQGCQDLAENRERAARAAEEVAKLPEEQLSNWLKTSKELREFKIELQQREAQRKADEQKAREEQAKRERETKEKAEREEKARRERETEERTEHEAKELQAIKERHDRRAAKDHKALDAKLESKLAKYKCSITDSIMLDPVSTGDGHVYEREAIEEWLKEADTSPKTNLPLATKTLIPNEGVKSLIGDFLEDHPELWDSGEVYASLALEVKFVQAVKNRQVNEVSRLLSQDKRLAKIDIADEKSLLSFALEQKSIEMTRLAVNHLGKEIKNIPELEKKDTSKLFRKAIYALGSAGGKLLGDALGMEQKEYQKEFWHGVNNGNSNLVRATLELKADPTELNADGLRPIHVATEKYEEDDSDAEEIITLLKEYGQVDNLDAKGCTALERAIINNKLEQTKILAWYGADVKKANTQGLTPLELSFEQIKTKHDSIKIAEILLEHKADANATDIHGQPLFSKALVAGMSDFMQLLVKHSVDVNKPDAKGELPIHQAFLFIGKEYATVLKILVQGGVKLEAKDSAGNTVLHIAAAKGLEDVVKLLLDVGANPETRNQANKKPLQLAKDAKKYEVVELLRAKVLERRVAPYLEARLQPLQQQIAEQKSEIEQLKKELAKAKSTTTTAAPAVQTQFASSSDFWNSTSSQSPSSSSMSSLTASAYTMSNYS